VTNVLLDSHVVHWWSAEPERLSRPAPGPSRGPGDPADRLIYATAIEHGWPLVTKDSRLRGHRHPRRLTVW